MSKDPLTQGKWVGYTVKNNISAGELIELGKSIGAEVTVNDDVKWEVSTEDG